MAELNMPLRTNTAALTSRVEALAAHVNAAPVGDPVAELAREIGEIDLDADLKFSTEIEGGEVTCHVAAAGNLARLLAAFDCHAQSKEPKA